MKTKLNGFLTLLLALVVQISFAQEKTVKGTVSDASGPLPGVTVLVKGTTNGTQTDFDGNYTIKAKQGDVIYFSYIGMVPVYKKVGASNRINVTMKEDSQALGEVVVTALGVSRDKKSLGYSTQEVGGDEVSKVKDANFMNSLSGKISGVQVKASGSMGGSTNVVIRGSSSLTGNNQALFVIDGILIDNSNSNTGNQRTGRGGYDYGNAASDINPDDIESVSVLKGGAASVLYGSKAANGVIIITTKKGKESKGLGVTINSGITLGTIDKETYAKYQKDYGAGYGPYYGSTGYFEDVDVNGDGIKDLMVPSTEDASFGAAFDPNKLVYQWTSFYPELPGYKKATPWVAAKNDPLSFFETAVTRINSVSLDGATGKGNFRLGYTNFDQEGILPNSQIKKNTIDLNASHSLSDKLKASAKVTYIKSSGKGRYGTGYHADNINQSFKQWYQVNADIQELKEAYFLTRKNVTWNTQSNTDRRPAYFDNPYWVRYENYQTDERSRVLGHTTLTYDVNDWFNIMGRVTLDTYNEIQEERTAIGSVDPSRYLKRLRGVTDLNYDLYLNFDDNFADDKLNVRGLIGANIERHNRQTMSASTTGGLIEHRLYSLINSKQQASAPYEYEADYGRNSVFANVSLGYDNTYFLEGSYRLEKASTLPSGQNTFGYYSASGSWIFSKLLNVSQLSYGKLRVGYAQTGNAAGPLAIYDVYDSTGNIKGNPLTSIPGTKNNANLKDELSTEFEIGLEAQLFENRLGLDVSVYERKSIDQIMSVSVSTATGYNSKWVNAGEMTNKGIELSLNATPVKTEDFQWDVNVNWSKNKNEVVDLYGDVKEIQLASVQGGISINATKGQPYGTIKGYDFKYKDGKRVVGSNGYYVKSDKKVVIGDVNPDWIGGISNSFKYKNLNFSFLIDVKKGGSVFSLDTWYGYATGIYANTSFINDLGKPVRNRISEGGGVILEGVTEDGKANTKRVEAYKYSNPWGYKHAPNAEHVYDAGFIKLREVALSYTFPKTLIDKLKINSLVLTATGKNLWIIDKSTPYADPEAGLSSGNIQGYQSGAYPAVKEYGVNLKIQF